MVGNKTETKTQIVAPSHGCDPEYVNDVMENLDRSRSRMENAAAKFYSGLTAGGIGLIAVADYALQHFNVIPKHANEIEGIAGGILGGVGLFAMIGGSTAYQKSKRAYNEFSNHVEKLLLDEGD
jgi:hypothetical protein